MTVATVGDKETCITRDARSHVRSGEVHTKLVMVASWLADVPEKVCGTFPETRNIFDPEGLRTFIIAAYGHVVSSWRCATSTCLLSTVCTTVPRQRTLIKYVPGSVFRILGKVATDDSVRATSSWIQIIPPPLEACISNIELFLSVGKQLKYT